MFFFFNLFHWRIISSSVHEFIANSDVLLRRGPSIHCGSGLSIDNDDELEVKSITLVDLIGTDADFNGAEGGCFDCDKLNDTDLTGTAGDCFNDDLIGTEGDCFNDELIGTEGDCFNDDLIGTAGDCFNDDLIGTEGDCFNDELIGTEGDCFNDDLIGTEGDCFNDDVGTIVGTEGGGNDNVDDVSITVGT